MNNWFKQNRKEVVAMFKNSDSDQNTTGSHWPFSATHVDHERVEEFSFSGRIHFDARTASGDIAIATGNDGVARVRVFAKGANAVERVEDAVIGFNSSTSTLTVTSRSKLLGRKLLDFGRDDIDIEVTLPANSDIEVHTASGDLVAQGSFGDLRLSSASGDAAVENVTGVVKIDSASGDVRIQSTSSSVAVRTVSGDISIGSAQGDTGLNSVSGDVSLTVAGPMEARLKTVSGDLDIKVVAGMQIDVDASSVSGDLRSEIALDQSANSNSSTPAVPSVTLRANSVSGDVTVRRA